MGLIIFHVLSFLLSFGEGERILGVFPIPSISHQVVYRTYVQELAKRGHEVVIITPDPTHRKDKLYENITEIDIHDLSYTLWRQRFQFAESRKTVKPKYLIAEMVEFLVEMVDAQLSSPQVKEVIDNPEEIFDLVVVETSVPIISLIARRFKTPLIGITSSVTLAHNYENIGNPTHCLVYSNIVSIAIGKRNIWDKIDTIYTDLYLRYIQWKMKGDISEVAHRHFELEADYLQETDQSFDLVFMNSHQILVGIRPLVPALVYLGSMHLENKKNLPKDLQIMLDESSQGVIYFSLGSNVMSRDLPPETRAIFMNVFRSLPYRVIWKWENNTLTDKPPNVHISKWLPQQDILGHPNVRVFITQGGQQSMEEAIYNGVPLIGIPFIADQFLNVRKMVSWGIAKELNINSISEDALKYTILQVAENKTYRDSIVRLGRLIRDEPMSARERAVWWTEYVLRHRGASHLRSPAVGMPWWEYFVLDVLVLIVITITVILLIVYTALRFLLSLNYRKSLHKRIKVQ